MTQPSNRPTLREVLEGLKLEPGSQIRESDLDLPVTNVTSDSRAVVEGSVFVAIRGESQDGHAFVMAAQQAGAILIVGEEERKPGLATGYVQVPDGRNALAKFAASFHRHPSHKMKVIGVTGTSGKTTITYLVESVLKAAGHEVGVIGTVNFRHANHIYPSTHTTPGPVELQQLLAQMRADGCTAVVMEVSSHALKQNRVSTVAFDVMAFTNLTPEHLDYHKDMEDYFQSKAILFTSCAHYAARVGKKPVAVINVDDPAGARMHELITIPAISLGLKKGDLNASSLKQDLTGIRGEAGGMQVSSPLTGSFNAMNILTALGVAKALGIEPEAAAHGIKALVNVPGRLERVANSKNLTVLVDYAHKPDALDKVLRSLQGLKGKNRIITVFGCGGDRDRTKRPVMGKIAMDFSDVVYITSDNPRTEDPEAIIREIVAGAEKHTGGTPFHVEADRKKAIHAAIRAARPGDIVLIAGKGHEDYQILGTRKVHFDDREVAAEALDSA